MEQDAIERLQAKSPEEAIIEQISRDFRLAPFMAKTQFEQMRKYFEQTRCGPDDVSGAQWGCSPWSPHRRE